MYFRLFGGELIESKKIRNIFCQREFRFTTASMGPREVLADFATAIIQSKSNRQQAMCSCGCAAISAMKAVASI